jgi:hypothetical protein
MSALKAEGVTKAFRSIPHGKRNFLIRRIDDAVKPSTRQRRVQEAVIAAHKAREKAIDQVTPK